jgi:hypothetical protein
MRIEDILVACVVVVVAIGFFGTVVHGRLPHDERMARFAERRQRHQARWMRRMARWPGLPAVPGLPGLASLHGMAGMADPAETELLRDEMQSLKERVAVLERVITDQSSASRLDLEFEKLKQMD